MEPSGHEHEEYAYSVVIPTMNRGNVVLDTASHLLEQQHLPRRVVIVDASDEVAVPSEELLAAYRAAGVDLVVLQSAPSTSGQRNRGVERVETPLVMFMDDDVWLPPPYVATLLGRWRELGFEHLGAMTGRLEGNPLPTRMFDRLYRQIFMLHLYDEKSPGNGFRLSQKIRYNDFSTGETFMAAVSTMAAIFRTDLARKHPFDERFSGYVLGEDHDMAARVAREAPILLVPTVRYVHERLPGERGSRNRWYHHSRPDAYFRLRRLEPSLAARGAFALSIAGELIGATADSLRERDPHHVKVYLRGLSETLRDVRAERHQQLRLHSEAYYALNRAYRHARIVGAKRRQQLEWEGVRLVGYHRVVPDRDVLAVSPSDFRRQLEWMLERGMKPVRVDSALDLLAQPVEGQWFAITFDDGYRDNLEYALPILEDLEVPATIYVPTAIIERLATYAWYRDPPRPLTWDEIRGIVEGGLVDVQAHTRTHRILPRLSDAERRTEIAQAKLELEARVPYTVTSIAYPAGIYSERDVELTLESGYRAGVTTTPGFNRGGEPLGELKRTLLLTGDTFDDFRAKITGALDEPSRLERLVRARRST